MCNNIWLITDIFYLNDFIGHVQHFKLKNYLHYSIRTNRYLRKICSNAVMHFKSSNYILYKSVSNLA